eukprot:TRINITY_DN36482_c0_g1_i1.p1 TRINITY_DN36482_c0_g1~~TRINITY_DN36482_c0_g1_i1.p1  ORF type:complete len:668 (-),score=136.51 TRINITY_DN36482_c0_g1_i1:27-2030(-)
MPHLPGCLCKACRSQASLTPDASGSGFSDLGGGSACSGSSSFSSQGGLGSSNSAGVPGHLPGCICKACVDARGSSADNGCGGMTGSGIFGAKGDNGWGGKKGWGNFDGAGDKGWGGKKGWGMSDMGDKGWGGKKGDSWWSPGFWGDSGKAGGVWGDASMGGGWGAFGKGSSKGGSWGDSSKGEGGWGDFGKGGDWGASAKGGSSSDTGKGGGCDASGMAGNMSVSQSEQELAKLLASSLEASGCSGLSKGSDMAVKEQSVGREGPGMKNEFSNAAQPDGSSFSHGPGNTGQEETNLDRSSSISMRGHFAGSSSAPASQEELKQAARGEESQPPPPPEPEASVPKQYVAPDLDAEVKAMGERFNLPSDLVQRTAFLLKKRGDAWPGDLREMSHALSKARSAVGLLPMRLKDLERIIELDERAKGGHLPNCMCATCKAAKFRRAVGEGNSEAKGLNASGLQSYLEMMNQEEEAGNRPEHKEESAMNVPLDPMSYKPKEDMIPEIRSLGGRLNIDGGLQARLMTLLSVRGDAWYQILIDLTTGINKARNPGGILRVRLDYLERTGEVPKPPCFHFSQGNCKFGARCKKSHDPKDLDPSIPVPPSEPTEPRKVLNQICFHFKQGTCNYGNTCKYSHGAVYGVTLTASGQAVGIQGMLSSERPRSRSPIRML